VAVLTAWLRGRDDRGPGGHLACPARLRPPEGVSAENPIHGCEQQSCGVGDPAVMITGHVPAVRVPPDHPASRVAAAVPARGDVEDRRDLDPAPPARRTAAARVARPGAELGGPGTAHAAAGHPGHDRALAPRHRPPPLGGGIHARQERPPGDPPEHQGPGPPAGPREPRMGLPQNPRGTGRPGSEGSGVDSVGRS
jgi:hypothetical protein